MSLLAMAPHDENVAPPDPPLVSVDIRIQDSTLKVLWGHDQGGSYPHYLADKDMVKDRGDKVREKLAGLVRAAREKEPAKPFARALKELARAGHALYRALFHATEGREIAEAVREDLESRTTPCRILVKVDSRIHIPWGLIYDGRVEEISDDERLEQYQDFFCIKHNLATSYNRLLALPKYPQDAPFQLLSVLNKQSFEAARQALAANEAAVLDEILERHRGPVFSKDEFERRWQEQVMKFGLVYFYCHADGKMLALGAEDTIDHFALQLLGDGSSDLGKGVCLFFLNGCATAIGSSQGGFLEATSARKGFCGFIGTEAKVPDVFALRFGTAFLHLFLTSGLPIWRVMERLRRQHWPLSLLYGVYGQPLVRLEPLAEAALPELLVGNFCAGVVGTNDLEGSCHG